MKTATRTACLILVITAALTLRTVNGWRSKTSESSGISIGGPKRIGLDKDKHRVHEHKSTTTATDSKQTEKDDQSQQFNIGLIVPHTNFGKREYQRAIGSAVATLQKMRDTKLPFLRDYEFTPKNVHFDMISLTPPPKSERQSFYFFFRFYPPQMEANKCCLCTLLMTYFLAMCHFVTSFFIFNLSCHHI